MHLVSRLYQTSTLLTSDRGAGTVDAVLTNELLLTRRLAQIEKERDGLAVCHPVLAC